MSSCAAGGHVLAAASGVLSCSQCDRELASFHSPGRPPAPFLPNRVSSYHPRINVLPPCTFPPPLDPSCFSSRPSCRCFSVSFRPPSHATALRPTATTKTTPCSRWAPAPSILCHPFAWKRFSSSSPLSDTLAALSLASQVHSSLARLLLEPAAIVVVMLVNAIVGAWQASDAAASLAALREMQAAVVRVVRDGCLVSERRRRGAPLYMTGYIRSSRYACMSMHTIHLRYTY